MVSFYPGHKANELAKAAQERYERAIEQLKIDEAATNTLAEEYGKVQLNIIKNTIGRFVAFMERNSLKVSESEKQILEGMDFSVQQLKEYKAAAIGAENYFKAGAKSAGAAAAGYGGAVSDRHSYYGFCWWCGTHNCTRSTWWTTFWYAWRYCTPRNWRVSC